MGRYRKKPPGNGRYGGNGEHKGFPIILIRPNGERVPASAKQRKKKD